MPTLFMDVNGGAFVRRIGEVALADDFELVGDLAEFLMPVAEAAADAVDQPVRWEPTGPWQWPRSGKVEGQETWSQTGQLAH